MPWDTQKHSDVLSGLTNCHHPVPHLKIEHQGQGEMLLKAGDSLLMPPQYQTHGFGLLR